MNSVQVDRAVGVLLGLATGDALGAGYEFGRPPTGDAEMKGGGLGNWEPGEWTDDTQMAICIAQVATTGNLDAEAVGEKFLDWYRSHPADVGVQTGGVLSGVRTAADLPARAQSFFERNPQKSAGNGSLMRTGPVALAHLGDDQALAAVAREISSLTHADPLAGDACVLWCVAIDRAIREGRLDGAWDGLALLPDGSRDRWAGILQDARDQPPASFVPNGFVVTALQAALASIVQTPVPEHMPAMHLQAALHQAVRIGGDTDTVAAIAGALLGARWGASAIPFRWKRMLHGWPGYRARDLARLALLSVWKGKPDKEGWPDVESLLPHYVANYNPRPISVALPEDPGVVIGNAAALPSISADAVISLCRVGTADVREGAIHDEVWLIDSEDATKNPNLAFVLADIADAIVQLREEQKTVFLHCVASESRTPTAAAAYLIRRFGMTPDQALESVRTVLPDGQPKGPLRAALDLIAADSPES